MSKKRTFRLFEDGEQTSKELLYEEVRNEQGQLRSYVNYESPETIEGHYEYNDKGQVVLEKEIIDGAEASKVAYEYDDKGNLIHTKQYVADEIFEEVIHEYREGGVTMRKVRFGEEIERQVEVKEGHQSTKEVYEEEALTERQQAEYNPETRTYHIQVEDAEGHHLTNRIRTEDEAGNLLLKEERNLKGQVLTSSQRTYENGKVTYEKHEDYLQGFHYEIHNEYDEAGRQVSTETRSLSGHIIEFEKLEYDDQGRVTATRGASRMGENFVLVHEYED